MADAPGLAALQRWMQTALLDPGAAAPDGTASRVLTASAQLGADRRLALYQHGCRMRLLESMRSLHPALVRLLGQDLFDRFAQEYLDACPSRSYLLSRLDEHFAEHLQRNRPDARGEHEPWVDVLIDLARLERLYTEVLDGPGTEEPGHTAHGRDTAEVTVAPCLRLLRTSAPVHHYLIAALRGEDADLPQPHPTWLAISRRDYVVVIRELASDAYTALHALSTGAPASRAVGTADPLRGRAWLREWAAAGYITVNVQPCAEEGIVR
ncbi:putative DNA-binding domain-containing protein [Kitasatospora aureofaciens]|uniref:HvfC/BufC family peptide modification chaperone n=1 Tax=Kitasatospora aureofaciens TaxID=1894 RepID=UPI00380B4800